MPRSLDLRKLPPLSALKGFEAAARLQSIRGAAAELNVTHPAISHQIKLLEQNLAVKLFSRIGRNIVLNPAGEALYPWVRQALETLIDGAEAARRSGRAEALRVQVYITNSIRWLAPRLPKFRALYPDIDLHLISSGAHWEFDENTADIGFVFNEGPVPAHLDWTKLFPSSLFPVCSPHLPKHHSDIFKASDLPALPLINVYTEDWNWQDWFEVANIVPRQMPVPIEVDTLAIALEMAVRGDGIALVNGPAANDDLASGRLIQPAGPPVPRPGEWGVICRKDMRQDPRIAPFIDWLKAEAAR